MHLTAAELRLLRLAAKGLPNKTIGRELGICRYTVNDHLKAIYRKLNVHNRIQAVVAAIRAGLLTEETQ